MKIRLLKPILVEGTKKGSIGEIIDVSETRANQLIRKAIAIPANDPKKIDHSKKAGPVPPTLMPQDGTHTGEEAQSSVLPVDQAQEEPAKASKRSSRKRKATKKSKS